jgi:hypothetical protein
MSLAVAWRAEVVSRELGFSGYGLLAVRQIGSKSVSKAATKHPSQRLSRLIAISEIINLPMSWPTRCLPTCIVCLPTYDIVSSLRSTLRRCLPDDLGDWNIKLYALMTIGHPTLAALV